MNTGKDLKRRIVLTVISAVMLFAAIFGVSYAEYVKSSSVKQVIGSYDNDGALFSSNYLVMNMNPSTNVYKRFFYTSEEGTPVSGSITFCNYAQGNPARTYEADIVYTVTAKLVTVTEVAGVYVKNDADAAAAGAHTVKLSFKGGSEITLSASNLSHTFAASTLDRHLSATDILAVEFDGDFKNAGSLCLYVAAVPTAAQAGVNTLDAVFAVALNSGEQRNVWEGEFTDSASGAPAQPYFDGFNYNITGVGSGTCTLSWDNTKLQISQVFLAAYGLTPAVSGDRTSVTFAVDSDVLNRYDLQFYYAEGAAPFASWAELTGSVLLTYTDSAA